MAGGAVLWSRLVKEYGFAGDQLCQLMALRTADSAVCTLQRESRAFVVVK